MTTNNTDKIRELNDKLRKNLILGGFLNTVLTSRVHLLPTEKQIELILKVQDFDNFNEGNDPYSEHDFGRISYEGQDYFFKIDYYYKNNEYASPNPADSSVTNRVLTIMCADEY